MYPVLIACLCVVFALNYALSCLQGAQNAWRSTMKTIPVLVLGIGALWLGSPWFLIAGLVMSAFGDWALSRDGTAKFLMGVAAFAVAHVFYALLFWSGSDKIVVIPAIVIVAYAISTEFWLIPRTGSLRWAVRIYVLFIASMALAALSTQSIAVIVGAILFLTSDSLIGRGKFLLGPDHPKGVTNDYLVWITYIAAQILFFLAYA